MTTRHYLKADVDQHFNQLSHRRVDLVSDYAGDELFMIEGDSLLLECFSDPLLDFEHGFQMLHAAFLVESLLQRFSSRKCRFHLVFFDHHHRLCIPSGLYHELTTAKFLLMRAVMIRHLQSQLKGHAFIEIHVFTSLQETTFLDYLYNSRVYFVMCHGGAGSNQFYSQQIILSFVHYGFTIALINGIEWRDTKAVTSILEGSQPERFFDPDFQLLSNDMKFSPSVIFKFEGRPDIVCASAAITERERLAIDVISIMIKNDPSCRIWVSPFFQHVQVLRCNAIRDRRVETAQLPNEAESFLLSFLTMAYQLLHSRDYCNHLGEKSTLCDLADMIDGRIFNILAHNRCSISAVSDANTISDDSFTQVIKKHFSLNLVSITSENAPANHKTPSLGNGTVLPFRNPIFNDHLHPIRLKLDEQLSPQTSERSSRIFQELDHWHNAARPLNHKSKGAIAKLGFYAHKRNQKFMTEIAVYAASLTNAVGGALDPETIVTTDTPKEESCNCKNEPKSGRAKRRDLIIAEARQKKHSESLHKAVQAWHYVYRSLKQLSNPESRYSEALRHMRTLLSERLSALRAEVLLCMINDLILIGTAGSRVDPQICALILNTLTEIFRSHEITATVDCHAREVSRMMGFVVPKSDVSITKIDRPLPFEFLSKVRAKQLKLPGTFKEFQLLHCGPYLDRSMDSSKDPRVSFDPDRWQRKVLDEIDERNSVFVVAPTSAGKTFISFYAMKQVLQVDDEGVLVYVAPTKALVNQIAAEVQARFSKSYSKKHAGKSVWAIHTRDYRINNPTGCQILVTVPHILQIMLLSEHNATDWSRRIRWIIFDEVHCIGQAEDGIIWEQLLLLAPCPIIALSATVGNPEDFQEWLHSTQRSQGRKLTMICHPHRYSDLRKFVYHTPSNFKFTGLASNSKFGQLGLDSAAEFHFVHPISSLVDRSRGIPDDLNLEPRDCLTLWRAMCKSATDEYQLPKDLDPSELPECIRKADVIKWESDLKSVLRQWMRNQNSPFEYVLKELRGSSNEELNSQISQSKPLQKEILPSIDILSSTLPLLSSLFREAALPVLIFNYDRGMCEAIAHRLLDDLAEAEEEHKKTSPKWIRQLAEWEKWKAQKGCKARSKSKVNKPVRNQGADPVSKLDLERDAVDKDVHPLANFDPEDLVDGFHFANRKKLQISELADFEKELRHRGVSEWLCQALKRGVGVHHAGMNRKYRHVVEILFRAGFLQVVIATGTLALGINMPTKTVVFSEDSVFLTALNFRQASGRAGRRGFDLLGNVVFQGISMSKVYRLMSSRLPDLNGHFPITTSLVLRLCGLLHNSGRSQYAVRAINSLLSQPRLSLRAAENKLAVLHHLRFSIEYLRQQSLLGVEGAPIHFAGLVSHLYYTENASFAFHHLLKEGYFHRLCTRIDSARNEVLLEMMLVMSHLFGRLPAHQSDLAIVKRSASIVFLPELPCAALTMLREHNQKVLMIFSTYVRTYIAEHLQESEHLLPLTRLHVGGAKDVPFIVVPNSLPPVAIRSAFVALSGHGDNFSSISELCAGMRSGVFLEQSVVPQLPIYPDDDNRRLNAHLYDFFKHGSIEELAKANLIRRNDIWFILNDFSMVLATIVASLQSYLRKNDSSDTMDMAEVAGGGDEWELQDDRTGEVLGVAEELTKNFTSRAAAETERRKLELKRAKTNASNLESWEDDELEEPTSQSSPDNFGDVNEPLGSHWTSSGEGLMNVLKAFTLLKEEFNEKFKAMWA